MKRLLFGMGGTLALLFPGCAFQQTNPKSGDYPGYKTSAYTIKGNRFIPMSVENALTYKAEGLCSHYEGGSRWRSAKTAIGENVKPHHVHAAHRTLPLPCKIRVTSLRTGRSMVVRVNDRGPFIRGRILDVSAPVAKELGFYHRGLEPVRIEVLSVGDGKWERKAIAAEP